MTTEPTSNENPMWESVSDGRSSAADEEAPLSIEDFFAKTNRQMDHLNDQIYALAQSLAKAGQASLPANQPMWEAVSDGRPSSDNPATIADPYSTTSWSCKSHSSNPQTETCNAEPIKQSISIIRTLECATRSLKRSQDTRIAQEKFLSPKKAKQNQAEQEEKITHEKDVELYQLHIAALRKGRDWHRLRLAEEKGILPGDAVTVEDLNAIEAARLAESASTGIELWTTLTDTEDEELARRNAQLALEEERLRLWQSGVPWSELPERLPDAPEAESAKPVRAVPPSQEPVTAIAQEEAYEDRQPTTDAHLTPEEAPFSAQSADSTLVHCTGAVDKPDATTPDPPRLAPQINRGTGILPVRPRPRPIIPKRVDHSWY